MTQKGNHKFAEFLQQRRALRELTLRELSLRMGRYGYPISSAAIYKWETAASNPPYYEPGFLMAMAASLEVSREDLIVGMGLVERSDPRLSSYAKRGADIVERLSPEGRALAIDLLRVLERHFCGTDESA